MPFYTCYPCLRTPVTYVPSLYTEGGGKGDFFRVGAGTFVILFPQDGHMPGMAISTPQPVKKFVVKVAIND